MPSPFPSTYGVFKAAVSNLASSWAVKGANVGSDVKAANTSYARTSLYAGVPSLGVLGLLERAAATPDDVATAALRAVGRVPVVDLGAYAWATCVVSRVIDGAALTMATFPFSGLVALPPETTATTALGGKWQA